MKEKQELRRMKEKKRGVSRREERAGNKGKEAELTCSQGLLVKDLESSIAGFPLGRLVEEILVDLLPLSSECSDSRAIKRKCGDRRRGHHKHCISDSQSQNYWSWNY